ncbi:MAG: hypothetical protein KDK40_00730 [Chlamydiia bacterium]|nr:hypothetical protein [Chlamydiia bacterium]
MNSEVIGTTTTQVTTEFSSQKAIQNPFHGNHVNAVAIPVIVSLGLAMTAEPVLSAIIGLVLVGVILSVCIGNIRPSNSYWSWHVPIPTVVNRAYHHRPIHVIPQTTYYDRPVHVTPQPIYYHTPKIQTAPSGFTSTPYRVSPAPTYTGKLPTGFTSSPSGGRGIPMIKH